MYVIGNAIDKITSFHHKCIMKIFVAVDSQVKESDQRSRLDRHSPDRSSRSSPRRKRSPERTVRRHNSVSRDRLSRGSSIERQGRSSSRDMLDTPLIHEGRRRTTSSDRFEDREMVDLRINSIGMYRRVN